MTTAHWVGACWLAGWLLLLLFLLPTEQAANFPRFHGVTVGFGHATEARSRYASHSLTMSAYRIRLRAHYFSSFFDGLDTIIRSSTGSRRGCGSPASRTKQGRHPERFWSVSRHSPSFGLGPAGERKDISARKRGKHGVPRIRDSIKPNGGECITYSPPRSRTPQQKGWTLCENNSAPQQRGRITAASKN